MALQVRALKRQLAAEKRTSSQLRSGLVQAQMSKSELEEFFLAAVEVSSSVHSRRCHTVPLVRAWAGWS